MSADCSTPMELCDVELSWSLFASRAHGQWTLALGGREITGICLPNHHGEAEGRSTFACDRARRGEASCRSRARGGSRRNDEPGGACRGSASGASLGRPLGRRACWVRARRRDRAERRSSRRTGCAPGARAPRARNPTRHGRLRLGCIIGICGQVTLTTFRDVPWNMPFYARLGFTVISAAQLSPALRARVQDEARRGLDPLTRVAMRFRCSPHVAGRPITTDIR